MNRLIGFQLEYKVSWLMRFVESYWFEMLWYNALSLKFSESN